MENMQVKVTAKASFVVSNGEHAAISPPRRRIAPIRKK
jgi:hypothetical protein